MGNTIRNYKERRAFKRYNFDDLLMEKIVSYMSPKDYLMLNRSYRIKAYSNYTGNHNRLFMNITSSEEDRDNVVSILLSKDIKYAIPTTLSERYWEYLYTKSDRFPMDEYLASQFRNRGVKFLAYEYVYDRNLFKSRDDLLDNAISDCCESLFNRMIRSSDLNKRLHRIIYSRLPYSSYFGLIRTDEQRKILSLCVCNIIRQGHDEIYYSAKYYNLLDSDIGKEYDRLRVKLVETLETAIDRNKQLVRSYRSFPRQMTLTTVRETYIRAYCNDDIRSLRAKIKNVQNENHDINMLL